MIKIHDIWILPVTRESMFDHVYRHPHLEHLEVFGIQRIVLEWRSVPCIFSVDFLLGNKAKESIIFPVCFILICHLKAFDIFVLLLVLLFEFDELAFPAHELRRL